MNESSGHILQLYLWLLAGAATLISMLASLIGVLLAWAVRAHLKVDGEFREDVERKFERIEDRINRHIDKLREE